MITGNKGEWSEIYTLFKVIADQRLFAGDSRLNKIENLVLPIVEILRNESNGTFRFSYDKDIVIVRIQEEVFRISIAEFHNQAMLLLNELQESKKGSFSIPEIERFINSYRSHSLKAKSSVKSDIRIVIHDQRTGNHSELGFSIKSQLGGSATLLNASKHTNFIFEVKNLELGDNEMNQINQINSSNKIQRRIQNLTRMGGALEFVRLDRHIFENNLVLIDSALPKILAEALLLFFTSTYSKTSDLTSEVARINPLNFDRNDSHPFYSYKMKRFLSDVALGMVPSKVWTGELDATGGYLVVKKDGEVLCYHIYNRNEFENYLFNQTKFETPSSKRHGFGSVYREDGRLYFKLNLQLRFL